MLAGEAGPQSREIAELAAFLRETLRPDTVCFSNALLVGAVRSLTPKFTGRIFCILQGDDIFLEGSARAASQRTLWRPSASGPAISTGFSSIRPITATSWRAISPCRRRNSTSFRWGSIWPGTTERRANRKADMFQVGYFARICPEKGLHQLVDGFRLLHKRHPNTRLRAAGYLGSRDRDYFEKLRQDARDLGTGVRVRRQSARRTKRRSNSSKRSTSSRCRRFIASRRDSTSWRRWPTASRSCSRGTGRFPKCSKRPAAACSSSRAIRRTSPAPSRN